MPRDVGRREEEEEEDKAGKQTEDVAVCRNPRWKKKKFNFDVGPQHHYLNVCVYDKVRSEDRGELLVGHVSDLVLQKKKMLLSVNRFLCH